jgi:hypothetical protein
MYSNTNPSEIKELFEAIVEELRPSTNGYQKYPDNNGEYWALCPFHNDQRIGSFSFNANAYHCFSCNASGSLTELGHKLGINGYSRTKRKPFNGITLKNMPKLKNFLKIFYILFRLSSENKMESHRFICHILT